MTAKRCPMCDRPRDVPENWNDRETCMVGGSVDCASHAVDWRSRAMAAEGRLRTLDRMAHDADDNLDDDDLCNLTHLGWEYRGRTFATIGDLADAWATAHPEATP